MGGIRPILRVAVTSKSESTTRGIIKFSPTEFQDLERSFHTLSLHVFEKSIPSTSLHFYRNGYF
jgi:hypothetical protein